MSPVENGGRLSDMVIIIQQENAILEVILRQKGLARDQVGNNKELQRQRALETEILTERYGTALRAAVEARHPAITEFANGTAGIEEVLNGALPDAQAADEQVQQMLATRSKGLPRNAVEFLATELLMVRIAKSRSMPHLSRDQAINPALNTASESAFERVGDGFISVFERLDQIVTTKFKANGMENDTRVSTDLCEKIMSKTIGYENLKQSTENGAPETIEALINQYQAEIDRAAHEAIDSAKKKIFKNILAKIIEQRQYFISACAQAFLVEHLYEDREALAGELMNESHQYSRQNPVLLIEAEIGNRLKIFNAAYLTAQSEAQKIIADQSITDFPEADVLDVVKDVVRNIGYETIYNIPEENAEATIVSLITGQQENIREKIQKMIGRKKTTPERKHLSIAA